MDKHIWTSPVNSRILGGIFPLHVLLRKNFAGKELRTLFDDLRQRDYGVITWSQRRPAGPIDGAVAECRDILEKASNMTGSGIILVGHSRGGLIARKCITETDEEVRGLITISTPHKGSSIAHITRYISPVAALIHPLFPGGDKGTLSFALKRVMEFLSSRALKELLPGSRFFTSMLNEPRDGVSYASLGGTSPTLFRIRKTSFPDVLERIIPPPFYPKEMKKGKGDGLVSSESARIPWGAEHHNFALNHAEILFDERVRSLLANMIEAMSS
jgi:pimeloyl-ACP methyl ester carboxylesterase